MSTLIDKDFVSGLSDADLTMLYSLSLQEINSRKKFQIADVLQSYCNKYYKYVINNDGDTFFCYIPKQDLESDSCLSILKYGLDVFGQNVQEKSYVSYFDLHSLSEITREEFETFLGQFVKMCIANYYKVKDIKK